MKKKITIEVWADINCPFCYIGEAMLQRVLQEQPLPDTEVEVFWRSYRLNAHMAPGKVKTWDEVLAEVDDPDELRRIERGNRNLKDLAKPYELEIHNEQTKLHNSIDAARLLKLAGRYQLVLEVAQAFSKAFFTDGLDLTDHQLLHQLAIQAGLPSDEVEQVLKSSLYLEEVEEDQRLAELYAPNFIPVFYFNGEEKREGVVSEEQLTDSLRTAYQKLNDN